ncbi:MAG: tellurite resistance TerB family protein [Pseudomonadota bacterium]
MTDDLHPLTPQDSLVAVMIAISASDAQIRTSELRTIQSIINSLPIFTGYDGDRMRTVAQVVFDLLDEDEGVAATLGLIRDNLPSDLYETAYAMACDVAAADGYLEQSELRMLQEIRYELDINRLNAAAIEVGSRARYKRS